MPYGRNVVIGSLWFLSPYALPACSKPLDLRSLGVGGWRRQAPHALRWDTLCSMLLLGHGRRTRTRF